MFQGRVDVLAVMRMRESKHGKNGWAVRQQGAATRSDEEVVFVVVILSIF
jgi:hypothetical protein